jgi:hypothetical protein
MYLKSVGRVLVLAIAASAAIFGVASPASAAVNTVTVPVYSYHTWRTTAPKVIAVLNASPGNNAPVIQYQHIDNRDHNDWMVLENENGTSLFRIKPLHTYSDDRNPHNDKCLAVKNNEGGNNQPIVSANCSYDPVNNDVWIKEHAQYRTVSGQLTLIVGVWQFRNQGTGKCLVVRSASPSNNAGLITFDCNDRLNYVETPNHYWLWPRS